MSPRKPKKPEAPIKCCANCEHYQPLESASRSMKLDAGQCRRYPIVYVPPSEGYEGFWSYPPTPADEKCGEHKFQCS